MAELSGSWALVTGASRGIGRSLVMSLARRGMSVVGVARSELLLQNIGQQVQALGGQFVAVVLDLAEVDAAQSLVKQLVAQGLDKKLRVVCMNAAVNAAGSFELMPLAAYERLLALNVIFPMQFIHRIIPCLKEHQSSYVVMFSSQAAIMPVPWMAVYAASKGFIHQLSLALSYEYASTNIKFLTVIPAHSETSANDAIELTSDLRQRIQKGQPPDKIAELIASGLGRNVSSVVSNVPGLLLFRAFVGLAPLPFVVRCAGKMFAMFRGQSFFEKPKLP